MVQMLQFSTRTPSHIHPWIEALLVQKSHCTWAEVAALFCCTYPDSLQVTLIPPAALQPAALKQC